MGEEEQIGLVAQVDLGSTQHDHKKVDLVPAVRTHHMAFVSFGSLFS